jgi:diguanylate cyclase (GGDEF)-like protein
MLMYQRSSEPTQSFAEARSAAADAASPPPHSPDTEGQAGRVAATGADEAASREPFSGGEAPRYGAELRAVRRVAGAAASGADLSGLCCLVAREACGCLRAATGVVFRFGDGTPATVGYWSMSSPEDDGSLARVGPDLAAKIAVTGGPVTTGSVVGVPILGPDGAWGAIVVADTPTQAGADSPTGRLGGFAELVGMFVVGAADRALLASGALDALTGLARRQTFDASLVREVTRAKRHGYPVSLAVLDIDRHSQIVSSNGRSAGDRALVRVARCLRDAAREDDLIARVARDQFVWLLPYCTPPGAAGATERLRADIAGRSDPDLGTITVSVGVCDLARGHDPGQLFALAQAACADARNRGGNSVHHYRLSSPEAGAEAASPARHDERTLCTSIYDLARAVDVKDPSTHGHSRRVADLSGHLAEALGWTHSRVRLIREAGLLYDVGKSCIPDDILLKSDVLTAAEYELVRTHVTVGAQIVEDVLTTEQVAWVRHHHERFDGGGYPDGLAGTRIPEGARILAVADSWDVMTTGRPYKTALSPEEALAECHRQAGRQFCPDVVRAIGQLWKEGHLTVGHRGLD